MPEIERLGSCPTFFRKNENCIGIIVLIALAVLGVLLLKGQRGKELTKAVIITTTLLTGLFCCLCCGALRAVVHRRNNNSSAEKQDTPRVMNTDDDSSFPLQTAKILGIKTVANIDQEPKDDENFYYIKSTLVKGFLLDKKAFTPETTIKELKIYLAHHLMQTTIAKNITSGAIRIICSSKEPDGDETLAQLGNNSIYFIPKVPSGQSASEFLGWPS